MRLYRVSFNYYGKRRNIELEANSEGEALEKAQEIKGGSGWEVERVKEKSFLSYDDIKEMSQSKNIMFLAHPVLVKADTYTVQMLNAASVIRGHNVRIPEDSYIFLYENGTFDVSWEDDTTQWEYRPNNGMTRHCGFGEGCFWTDWE